MSKAYYIWHSLNKFLPSISRWLGSAGETAFICGWISFTAGHICFLTRLATKPCLRFLSSAFVFFFLWAVEVRDSKSLALPVKKYSNSQTSWWHITCDEIITDYNTKAVNVVVYQKRDNNSDTAGKGCKQNSTTEKQISYFKGSALFDPFCCPESIVIYLRQAVFIFATDKASWAKPTFARYIF